MTPEFNLSEKIYANAESIGEEGDVRVRDVKEFIKLLKEQIFLYPNQIKTLNALVGDKLK